MNQSTENIYLYRLEDQIKYKISKWSLMNRKNVVYIWKSTFSLCCIIKKEGFVNHLLQIIYYNQF